MSEMRYFRKKICLLGDAAVGKTSLIRRYVEDKFDDKYVVTLGTKVTMKELTFQDPVINEPTNITLMIWDILGQREYKRLQTSFYRGANAALIVVDITRRETLEHLDDWILSLFNSIGKVPILILLNKSDLEEQAAIKADDMVEIVEKYNSSYLSVSAKTGENVDMAFLKLSEILMPKAESEIPEEGEPKEAESAQLDDSETETSSDTEPSSNTDDNPE
jgi:small GTP-binding protein